MTLTPNRSSAKATQYTEASRLVQRYDPDTWAEPKTPHELLMAWATRRCTKYPEFEYARRPGGEGGAGPWEHRATVTVFRKGQEQGKEYQSDWCTTQVRHMGSGWRQVPGGEGAQQGNWWTT